MLIQCPTSRRDESNKDSFEPFAQEAKYFTDCRLLQREIQIILEGVSSTQNYLGSIIHPAGNIAELLLKEGFAKCVDWSMGVLTSGHEKYRQAERYGVYHIAIFYIRFKALQQYILIIIAIHKMSIGDVPIVITQNKIYSFIFLEYS